MLIILPLILPRPLSSIPVLSLFKKQTDKYLWGAACVTVGGRDGGISALRGLRGWHLGPQAGQQMPLAAEPSCQQFM